MNQIVRLAVFLTWLPVAFLPMRAAAQDLSQVQIPQELVQMKDQILSNPELTARLLSLQQDPQVQALLADPKVLGAVASGDYDSLLHDPRIVKIMQNHDLLELGRVIEQADEPDLTQE